MKNYFTNRKLSVQRKILTDLSQVMQNCGHIHHTEPNQFFSAASLLEGTLICNWSTNFLVTLLRNHFHYYHHYCYYFLSLPAYLNCTLFLYLFVGNSFLHLQYFTWKQPLLQFQIDLLLFLLFKVSFDFFFCCFFNTACSFSLLFLCCS